MMAKAASRKRSKAITPSPAPTAPPAANDTERRLMDCALSVFAEKGYSAASVRDIIQATGVTRPVLYYYAKSKEDLFKRVVRWTHDHAYEEFAAIAAGKGAVPVPSAQDRLKAMARGSFAFCAADPRIPQLMFQAAYGPAIPELSSFLGELASLRFGIVQSVMQAGLDSGEFHGGSAASLALVYCCLIDQHLNILSRLPKPQAHLTPTLANALVGLFLGGVGQSKNRPIPPLPDFAV